MQEFYQKTAWENEPSANSPINEDNLNNIEDGIGELDSRVATLSNTKSNVDWVQLQTDGKKIAEVTIDGVKKNVYVPRGTGGSGGASSWEELEEKPFETLDNNNFNVSDGILSIKDKASGVEVSAIKESLTQFKDDGFLPKNLLNKSTDRIGIGMADNGTENTNGNAEMTEYIEVLPNRTCTISWLRTDTNMATRVALYDESKAFISLPIRDVRTEVSTQRYFATFNTTSNTKYLRANFSKAHKDVQIEYGNEMTEYSIYSISNTGLTTLVDNVYGNGFASFNILEPFTDTKSNSGITCNVSNGAFVFSGTPTSTFYLQFAKKFGLKKGKYQIVLDGGYSVSDASNAYIRLRTDSEVLVSGTLSNKVISFELSSDKTDVYIVVFSSQISTLSGTMYVQIQHDSDNTKYTPYVPSNSELKQSLSQLEEVKTGIDALIVTASSNVTITEQTATLKGGVISFSITLNCTNKPAYEVIFTTSIKPRFTIFSILIMNNGTVVPCYLDSVGNLRARIATNGEYRLSITFMA